MAGLGGSVLVEEVIDRDGLVAGRAESAGTDTNAGPLAVWAPLHAEIALIAFGAVVDGDVAAMPGGREDEWRGGEPATVGGLAAGLAAVALPAHRREAGPADRAGLGCRHVVVTQRGSASCPRWVMG